jgi:WW domain-containing oxidoreductase
LIQVFVVTGASSGLGLAITCHLLKHNAAKIITLSSREESAIKATEQLKSWGDTSRIVWHRCDLKDLRQVDQVARKLREEKRIDAVRDNREGMSNHLR